MTRAKPSVELSARQLAGIEACSGLPVHLATSRDKAIIAADGQRLLGKGMLFGILL
jgi:hypothetical protein